MFGLFLDDSMTYSCAYFESPDVPLHEAQEAKLDRVCRKLELGPDDHLLEIGTGWGSLALHAAGRYGCRVTTTTISREQRAVAVERVRELGLEDHVTVLLEDYRDLRGRFDKLVSIEMIEAVGWQYFDTFFRRCAELLRPDGLMLLQAITIADRAYELEKATRSFIRQLIFPAGCLPSVEVIRRCVERVTDLRMLDLEDITDHYPETLRRWRENFVRSEKRAAELGYDQRFRRLWELYFVLVRGRVQGAQDRRRASAVRQAVLPRLRLVRDPDPGPDRVVKPGTLNYVRRGSGEPLVLIHPLGAELVVWEPVIERLARRARRDRGRPARLRPFARAAQRRRSHAAGARLDGGRPCSTTSASSAPTWPATRWAAGSRWSSPSPGARCRSPGSAPPGCGRARSARARVTTRALSAGG